jgi:hypothetical protein
VVNTGQFYAVSLDDSSVVVYAPSGRR